MKHLTINEELKTLLPPLSEHEYAGLEQDILQHGCLSPLIIWNDILVDGHHRYEICSKHEIPFSTQTIVFENLDAAKLWAWKHQEHRRNLTAYHRAELALKLKDTIAAKAKERQGKRNDLKTDLPQNSAEGKETRQELAEMGSVSHDTLKRVEYLTQHADEQTKQKLLKGEKGTSINKEYNKLKAEKNAVQGILETESDDDNIDANYPPLSQPIPKKDWQFEQTVKLQNISLTNTDSLIACLFDLFEQSYREQLVLDLMSKMAIDDGKRSVERIMSKLNTNFS
jgi:hypothetical protein